MYGDDISVRDGEDGGLPHACKEFILLVPLEGSMNFKPPVRLF